MSDRPDDDLVTQAMDDAVAAPEGDDRLSPLGPPPKVLSPIFWIVLAFGVLCVLAGAGLAVLGPRLYPHNEPPLATVPR